MSSTAPYRMVFLKEVHPQLHQMIRGLSKKRFEDIGSRHNLELEDHEYPDDFLYGSHLTVIQIAARDLRITFKSHFNLSEVKILTERKNHPERSSRQIMLASYDLFKEYSNLVAGGITQQLHSCGIVAGISLPLATSGFDEVIASDELHSTRSYDFWRVKGPDFSFVCSMYAEIFDKTLLSGFEYHELTPQEEEGDIEML